MPDTFFLSVQTPEHVFYSGMVKMLNVEALDGRLCVLSGHAPTVLSLAEGELEFRDAEGQERWAAASDGFMTVTQDKVVVMLDTAEWPEDIDRVRAERAARRAREAMMQKLNRQSYLMNQAMLLRAMTRLRVSSRRSVNNE